MCAFVSYACVPLFISFRPYDACHFLRTETPFVSTYLDQFGMELHMGAPRHFVPFVFFVHKEYVRRPIAFRLDFWHDFFIFFVLVFCVAS